MGFLQAFRETFATRAVKADDELLTQASAAMTEDNDPDDGYAALYDRLTN